MSVPRLLETCEGRRARSVARRLGGWTGLAGTLVVAAALFLERAGVDLPLLALPAGGGHFFGWVLISLAGLFQAALALAAVFAAAFAVSRAGALLRRPALATARDLDARLGTDRFLSAIEAQGPLAPLVERAALSHPPPPGLLDPGPPGFLRRWLTRAAVVLALLIALLPGIAPAGEAGPAPVPGEPGAGERKVPLELVLVGPDGTILPDRPVPMALTAKAEGEFDLPVRLCFDGGEERATTLRIASRAGAAVRFDLLPWLAGLAAGEHRLVARAGEAESNAWIFRLEPPPAAEPPPPPASPENAPPPEGGEQGTREPTRPKFVEPLVREGETVEKDARVPIEAPDGGAPSDQPIDKAWPELKRRQEAALNRPGLSPGARALLRAYFERLQPRPK